MQDDPTKQSSDQTESKPDANRKRKPFATFLIESELKPLVFAGRCMQYFGIGTVVGFLLGAVGVYGYAFVVKSLPLISLAPEHAVASPSPTPSPAVQSKVVPLRGNGRDKDGKPITGFWVAVLVYQTGPVYDSQGSFKLNVPQSNSYDVALWDNDRHAVFNNLQPEPDGDGYRLPWALPLSSIRVPSTAGLRSRPDLTSREQFARMHLNSQIETEGSKK